MSTNGPLFLFFMTKKRKKVTKKFVGKNKSFYLCGRKGTKIIRKIPNKEIFLICFSRLVLSSLFLKIGCREIPDFFMPTGVDFSADYTIFFSCQTCFLLASFVSNRFVRNGGVRTPLSVSMALGNVPIVKIYCGICA